MITEPELSDDVLRHWLNTHYGIIPQAFTFLPIGECGWHYRVADDQGIVYVLKLTRAGMCSTPPMTEQTVRAVQALYYEFGITQMMPPPLRASTGQHVNPLAEYTAVLYRYMEGQDAQQRPLDETQQRQLGALLGRIHRAKLHARERPAAEDFAPHIPVALRRILDEAATPTRAYAPFHLKFLQIIQTIAPRLEARLQEFSRLRQRFAEDAGLHADFVICHGDPTAGNILIQPDDTVMLIDWDAPVFAPRERDLFFVRQQPLVMEAYEKVVGAVALRPEVLRFYQLQWDLGEIAEFGTRILFRRQSKIQNKHDTLEIMAHLKGLNWV